MGRDERSRRATETLQRVGLKGVEDRYPHELSVGMAQRASLARALVSNPAILLMDEPFASVDALTRRVLQQDLLALWRERQHAIVFVTHDIAEAVLLGDRVLVQSAVGGRIAAEIPIDLERPRGRGEARALEIEREIWALLEQDVRSASRRTE
jgi:NitT/TauT family transport system ATP-binding protein